MGKTFPSNLAICGCTDASCATKTNFHRSKCVLDAERSSAIRYAIHCRPNGDGKHCNVKPSGASCDRYCHWQSNCSEGSSTGHCKRDKHIHGKANDPNSPKLGCKASSAKSIRVRKQQQPLRLHVVL
jgi:hypothetical protein